jgi:16S rRNA (adenine1518-N6/adenine1519-N6)-dimethyltransferase
VVSRHIPRKRFGQHFLHDAAVVDAMLEAVGPKPGDALLEIGPGLGALTSPLLQRTPELVVIELDRDLAARWQRHPGVVVVAEDVLRVNLSALPGRTAGQRWRVVGNLPYNISTPILFHLMAHVHGIADQHLMLQKEVIDRMLALPASKAYGRLSVMLQWRYAMHRVLDVPPEAFDPPPKVQSAVVAMVPRAQPQALDAACLQALLKAAFGQRRKLLRHGLGPWLDAQGYGGDFDLMRRAEEVPASAYWALAQAIGPTPDPQRPLART